MSGARATITAGASAFPPSLSQDELWRGYFQRHSGEQRLARAAFAAAGVRHRHAVANPCLEDVAGWSTEKRMRRYLSEALPLGKAALVDALGAADLSPGDVGMFAVASCTGYATPGLDVLLSRDLAMAPSLVRLSIGHMGCHAALPALGAVADFVRAHDAPAVLLCLELSSLHLQANTAEAEQAVIHALFSDAAAAVVVQPGRDGRGGLEVLDSASTTVAAAADLMTWVITDHGFRMGLSRRVPELIGQHVRPLVDTLLARHGLSVGDVDGWAVHPGGPRVLERIATALGLRREALQVSFDVLAEHGNCSSATMLIVLEELTRTRPVAPGGYLLALAFGPGLTLCATLLRAC